MCYLLMIAEFKGALSSCLIIIKGPSADLGVLPVISPI